MSDSLSYQRLKDLFFYRDGVQVNENYTSYFLSAFTVWVLLLTSVIKLDSIAASLSENNWLYFPHKTVVRPREQDIGNYVIGCDTEFL